MQSVTVIARVRAKEGRGDDLKRAMEEAIGPTHLEDGCVKYSLQRSLRDPDLFVVIEKWSSPELLDKHLASKHIAALFLKLPELLAVPPEIQVFRPTLSGDPAKADI